MAISINAIIPNRTIPPGTSEGGLHIFSGIIECVFKGDANGGVTRDTLTFTVGRVNLPASDIPPASCIVSLASFTCDGVANDVLWAVDSTQVLGFVNEDRGSGTADVEVAANLAVRASNAIILRVNYILFYMPS